MLIVTILTAVYGIVALLVAWRSCILVNRTRTKVLISKGVKTDFASFIPNILREAISWPLSILWRGLYNFIRELE